MNMRSNRVMIAAMAVAAATLSGVGLTRTAEAQGPPQVEIKDIELRGGAGCPEGTAVTYVTEDRQAFVITYDEFAVAAGPGIPPEQNVAACTATIILKVPPGWSWTVSRIVYSGSAQLDDDVTGRMSAKLSFPGQRPVAKEVRLKGPTPAGGKDFDLVGEYDILAWSRCGSERPMTALASAQVDNSADRNQSGIVRVSQQTGEFQMVFYIGWRRC